MAFIDYYKILGVDKSIPQKDVRRAYLKRVKQFHPDQHQDDPKAKAKFQALQEAYEVIGDPAKRAKYDQYGENWRQADAFGGGGKAEGFSGFRGGGNPFGGFEFSSFKREGGFKSFFEQIFGKNECDFEGTNQYESGAPGQSMGTMRATVDIPLRTALLGGDVELALRDGNRVRLRIKPETQNGAKVRLRGKGYEQGDGTFGDLIVTYNVKLPTGLTARQRELLRQAL